MKYCTLGVKPAAYVGLYEPERKLVYSNKFHYYKEFLGWRTLLLSFSTVYTR